MSNREERMGKRILVVEDEPDQLTTLKFRLEANGYEVISASDGEEGLAKAQKEHPDLILLDIMLPKMDGFEVCRRLKQDKSTSSIPVIGLTAYGRQYGEDKARAAGVNDYMDKAYEPKDLIARINSLLNK